MRWPVTYWKGVEAVPTPLLHEPLTGGAPLGHGCTHAPVTASGTVPALHVTTLPHPPGRPPGGTPPPGFTWPPAGAHAPTVDFALTAKLLMTSVSDPLSQSVPSVHDQPAGPVYVPLML